MTFLQLPAVFAQKSANNDTIVNNYNQWLKTIELNKLLGVNDIKLVKNTLPGPDSLKKFNGKLLLVLTPVYNYAEPLKMATAWNYIRNGYLDRKIDIYTLLLNKLSTLAALPLNSVMIEIATEKPKVFSLRIYFDNEVKHEEQTIDIRGGDKPIDYNFNSALANVLHGDYILPASTNGLTQYLKVFKRIFESYEHKGDIQVVADIATDAILKLRVYNVWGHVTGDKYHEKIEIWITKTAAANNQVEVSYLANVYYAGGIFVSRVDEKSYHDAANTYLPKLVAYNAELDNVFKKIFNYGR